MNFLKERASLPKTVGRNQLDYHTIISRDGGAKCVKRQYSALPADDDAFGTDVFENMFPRKWPKAAIHHDKAPHAHRAHGYPASPGQGGAGRPADMRHALVLSWLEKGRVDTAPAHKELLKVLTAWRCLTTPGPRDEQHHASFSIAFGGTSIGWLQSFQEKSVSAHCVREWSLTKNVGSGAWTSIHRRVENKKQARLTGPIQFLTMLLDTWHLESKDAASLLGLESRDMRYVGELLKGSAFLKGKDAEQRIAQLFRIRKTLFALFRDEEAENEWLRERRDALGGKTPLDRLLDGSIESMVLVKELVEAAAGR